jgi:hypothetical protein
VSIPRTPDPALLVLSVLSARWGEFWPGLLADLETAFGPTLFVSEPMDFTVTGYYDAELGTPIQRRMLAFSRLVAHEFLVDAKLATNELERSAATPPEIGGRRLYNLDPGLLTLERLVLATGKNFTHRIYLGNRVWADLTMIWTGGGWFTLPWTFADYAAPSMLALLTRLRARYKDMIQNPAPAQPDA